MDHMKICKQGHSHEREPYLFDLQGGGNLVKLLDVVQRLHQLRDHAPRLNGSLKVQGFDRGRQVGKPA